jgi:hypothetical protein
MVAMSTDDPPSASAQFTCRVFQNRFLPEGGTDVHAIVSVSCSGAGPARGDSGDVAEIIIVGSSWSMRGEPIRAARAAAAAAIDQMPDGTWFALIAGTEVARPAYPFPETGSTMVRMDPETRVQAKEAAEWLGAAGGRAMGEWLRLAGRIFDSVPLATQRHAILLTDGPDEDETPEDLHAALREVTGRFQCECFGVGERPDVRELRMISNALLGSAGLVPEPEELPDVLAAVMYEWMSRGVPEAQLQVWTPQGARVMFVRQVAPHTDELTNRRTLLNPLTGAYPTGAWTDETREYYLAVRLPARPVGSEQAAARVQLTVGNEVVAQALIRAVWSADQSLTSRINPAVAHYTGLADLVATIRAELAAGTNRPDANRPGSNHPGANHPGADRPGADRPDDQFD